MNDIARISAAGRQAAVARDWNRVAACGLDIRRRAPSDPEGLFLLGLAQKGANKPDVAAQYFSQALELNTDRYDAAIELAFQQILLSRNSEASKLLGQYKEKLSNSPMYLDLAGQAYSKMGMYESAWPLFDKARQLQPTAEVFQANLAACGVFLGKIDEARTTYKSLLKKHPAHQRNHYELANLQRATTDQHVKQMLYVLKKGNLPPARNIFLYYALAKELEDLERWDDAFEYYAKAGDAVTSTMDYDVQSDVSVMDKIIEVCTTAWLADKPATRVTEQTPVFIVGLPRTGTTLTDRILSSHSQVESVGETQLVRTILRRVSGFSGEPELPPDIIAKVAKNPDTDIAQSYVDAISYRLSGAAFFIDKLPENVLYLGFIAKAWPNAKIVHLRRNPMDACFAMYKQSFFKFAYTLDDLAKYYLAYDRLSSHWRNTLGDRMLEVEYENLVTDQEGQTRRLLEGLNFPFEEACLHFEQNAAPIATASSAQVRQKVHTRSVNKWKKFERQLQPLKAQLEAGNVTI